MKIAIITDAHANLPALEAAVSAIQARGCDVIAHTGDAIAIGPYPAECLDLLLRLPNAWLLQGNHDAWFARGLPSPLPDGFSEGEVAHQQWTHAQIDPARRAVVARWPCKIERELAGVRVTFVHWALVPGGERFAPFIRERTAEAFDRTFAAHATCQIVFHGHDHEPSDVHGRARYVNPGALGCGKAAVARFCIVTCCQGRAMIERHAVPYDDAELYRAFEQRRVPERGFIYRAFYGGRFGGSEAL